ncbi:MAG: hypothetical protein ACRD8W_00490 [Nitrososphaeraceae archaeon]
MATNTPRWILRKPAGTDLVNVVTDLGDNFDKIDKAPRGEISYGVLAVNQTPITAEVDVNNCTLAAYTTQTGQKLKITFTAMVSSSVAGDVAVVALKEDGVTIREFLMDLRLAGNTYTGMMAHRFLEDAGAAHVYKLTLRRVVGTGNLTAYANNTSILLEDIGAT